MKKRIALFAAVLIAMLLVVPRALAGGWAVVTLKSWPENVQAGETQTIEFVVRGHGQNRTDGFNPLVTAEHVETGKILRFEPYPLQRTGEYGADLVFPEAGEWRWGISLLSEGQYPQTMPPLTVSPGKETAGLIPPEAAGLTLGTLVAGAGALALFGGAILYVIKPSRTAVLTAGAGVLVIAVGLLAVPRVGALAGASDPEPTAVAELSAVDRGRLLFQAKGCIVCHNHDELRAGYEGIESNIGPDLSYGSKRGLEYLKMWLADPKALKPKTAMPNLELSEDEIDALAAFIMGELDQ